ncbi:MAG: hypothetical protein ABH833_00220 [Parcubacteria group bacterium]
MSICADPELFFSHGSRVEEGGEPMRRLLVLSSVLWLCLLLVLALRSQVEAGTNSVIIWTVVSVSHQGLYGDSEGFWGEVAGTRLSADYDDMGYLSNTLANNFIDTGWRTLNGEQGSISININTQAGRFCGLCWDAQNTEIDMDVDTGWFAPDTTFNGAESATHLLLSGAGEVVGAGIFQQWEAHAIGVEL